MKKILLVTDTPWVVTDVEAGLLSTDFELSVVTAGEEVLSAMSASTPDILLLDLQIGDMGAVAVLTELRNTEGDESTTPVVLLIDREADEWLARRLGADRWILKPMRPGALTDAIEQLTAAA